MLETFNFPYHGVPGGTPEDSSSSIQLGHGFKFSNKPAHPILRVYELTFPVMKYFLLPDGSPDTEGTINPLYNIAALERFYERHETYKTFIYPHPFWGNKNVRFDTPFTVPQVIGNHGAVSNLTVRLREHP